MPSGQAENRVGGSIKNLNRPVRPENDGSLTKVVCVLRGNETGPKSRRQDQADHGRSVFGPKTEGHRNGGGLVNLEVENPLIRRENVALSLETEDGGRTLGYLLGKVVRDEGVRTIEVVRDHNTVSELGWCGELEKSLLTINAQNNDLFAIDLDRYNGSVRRHRG